MKDSQWIFFLPSQDLFQPYSTSLLPAASTHSLVQIWLWQQSSQLLLIIITGHKDLPRLNVSKNACRVLWLFFFSCNILWIILVLSLTAASFSLLWGLKIFLVLSSFVFSYSFFPVKQTCASFCFSISWSFYLFLLPWSHLPHAPSSNDLPSRYLAQKLSRISRLVSVTCLITLWGPPTSQYHNI